MWGIISFLKKIHFADYLESFNILIKSCIEYLWIRICYDDFERQLSSAKRKKEEAEDKLREEFYLIQEKERIKKTKNIPSGMFFGR